MREQLKDFATWSGIVGWVTIIGGALQALPGLFMFLIGAIPGILVIILGLKLLGARKHALAMVGAEETSEAEMLMMVRELTTYFKIQGILIILGVIVFLVILPLMLTATSFL